MPWPIDVLEARFPDDRDAAAVAWLAGVESAHPDLADELVRLVDGLGVEPWSPGDPAGYPPVIVPGRGGHMAVIAVGMRRLAIRPPAASRGELAEIGEPHPLGPEWVAVDPFDADEPRAARRELLERWCRAAVEAN